MRTSKQKAIELEQQEGVRAEHRKSGLSLMEIRDRGWARLTNGTTILWPVDRELDENEARRFVPEGHFIIDTGKEDFLFETDEVQKWIRWA